MHVLENRRKRNALLHASVKAVEVLEETLLNTPGLNSTDVESIMANPIFKYPLAMHDENQVANFAHDFFINNI